jgi:hypothetical protein
MLFAAASAKGVDGSWNVPSGGRWSEAANWTNGIVANGDGAAARFETFPGPDANRPLVTVDTDLTLGKVWMWVGDNSPFFFTADRDPGSGALYTIDAGTNKFINFSSRTVNWKVPVAGTGGVELQAQGFFEFRVPQPFTGPLVLPNRVAYKGFSYQSYADSGNPDVGDLLAAREIRLDYSTLRVSGRFPRPASTWPTWEVRPGDAKVTLLGATATAETLFSPGQTVTGEHVPEGTFIRFFQDDATVILSQPLADDFAGVLTQALSFAAAPRWDATQRLDRLASESAEAAAIGSVQFQPHIASGYGSNSVTLHVGELAGTRPFLVSVNTGTGGWDGRLRVDRAEEFNQAVTLQNTAALVLGDQRAVPDGPAEGAAFWVDASDAASLTKDGAGNVTRWDDTRGAGYPYAESWLDAPTYLPDALNGLPVVDFGAQGDSRGLRWNVELAAVQTVFWVIGSQAGGGSLLGRKPGGTAHNFIRGFDTLKGGTAYLGRENGLIGINEAAGENLWINGALVLMPGAGLSGGYDLVAAQVNASRAFKASAFGYVDTQAARFNGGQRLAEVIVYTNALTARQIQDTEAYLYKKWFDREFKGYGAGKVNFLATAPGAEARLGQAGAGPVEARHVTHGGNLAVMAGSTVKLKADGALPKLTLADGAKVILKARKIPASPSAEGTVLWLDASREADFTFGTGTEVGAWRNRGGGSVQAVTPGTVKPSRVQDGQGRWLVDLGPRDNGCCLMTLSNLMARSAFIVWLSATNGAMPLGSLKQGYAGHNEFRAGDFNRGGFAAMLTGASRTATGGDWRFDGLPIQPTVTAIPTNRLMLVSSVMQGWGGRVSSLGGYGFDNTSATYLYSGGMRLAEVILYDRSLEEDERCDVEAYLMKKWFGTLLPGYAGEDGACRLREVAVSGAAEIETEGNAVVSIGTVTGGGTLTAGGDATVAVGNVPNPNTVAVDAPVRGVTVTRAGGDAPTMPAAGAALHFDAAAADSITLYKSGGVDYAQYWIDRIGGVQAESAFGPAAWIPLYKANAANGLPAIDFGARGSNRGYKWSPRLTNIRTVFWMVKDKGATTGGGFLLGTTDTTYNNSHFARGGNNGTLLGHSPLFHDSRSPAAVKDGAIFIDGERRVWTDVPKWDWQVVSIVTAGDCFADQIAADRQNYQNFGGLEVGEVIIYTNALDRAACEATEDYLMTKWLGRRSPRAACAETQSVVTAWGTVPLTVTARDGDGGAEIAALRGDGEVVIDGADVTVLSDAETFGGRVVLRDGSRVTVGAARFAASEWIVEAGSVLDLGGQTVTLAGIGGDGCVSNGTLVVSHVSPGLAGAPGTLTVKGDLALAAGATVTVHYVRPACDALRVTGTLTVAGGGTVVLKEPVELGAGFSAPLITYGGIEGLDRLLTEWACAGDYSAETFNFHLEPAAGNVVLLKGFADGTMLMLK